EVGRYGIKVNNILPGAINTQRLEQIIQNKADKLETTYYNVEKQMIGSIPLGRIGDPDEIANGALFLASQMSNYVSGINLIIDGGRTRVH
ncbi:SDR family oxidoreductase, partial [archaeon]|nr:SDR family oxidoreductase [archaeon]